MPVPRPPRLWLRRFLWRARHAMAALCLALAAVLVLDALRPPAPPTQPVLTLARDVPAGTDLVEADLVVRPVPSGTVPAGALTQVRAAVGAPLAVGLPRGSVVTPAMLVGPGLAEGAPPGTTVVAVPLADPGSAHLALPGTRVDLLAAPADTADTGGPATVVAADVLVLALLADDGGSGLLTGGSAATTTVYVAAEHAAATLLVGASAWAPLRAALVR